MPFKKTFILMPALAALSLSSCGLFSVTGDDFSFDEKSASLVLGETYEITAPSGTSFTIEGDAIKQYSTESVSGGTLFTYLGIAEGTATLSTGEESMTFTVSENENPDFYIELPDGLQVATTDDISVVGIAEDAEIEWRVLSGDNIISLEGRTAEGLDSGEATVVGYSEGLLSNADTIDIKAYSKTPETLELLHEGYIYVGESSTLEVEMHPYGDHYSPVYTVSEGSDYLVVDESTGVMTGLAVGEAEVTVTVGTLSDSLTISIEDGTDPYENVDWSDFHNQNTYTRATSYRDAQLRSAHGLMSGTITTSEMYETSSGPTVANNRPTDSSTGQYIRNTAAIYGNNNLSYTVLDSSGEEAFTIYYGGGYCSLNEVAAYVYAWGETPANYVDSKSPSDGDFDLWGKYLRANNTYYTNDVAKYPKEPELPEPDEITYYEIDIGGSSYNTGTRISRGSFRLVYSRYRNGKELTDPEERYVFYTYNHYYDYQEYLNYEYGWGERFGYYTGNYSVTPYVEVTRADIRDL